MHVGQWGAVRVVQPVTMVCALSPPPELASAVLLAFVSAGAGLAQARGTGTTAKEKRLAQSSARDRYETNTFRPPGSAERTERPSIFVAPLWESWRPGCSKRVAVSAKPRPERTRVSRLWLERAL
jgi:hypothetical protein